MHHKRKRPKNRRSGCLMCKPHKMNGAKDNKPKYRGAKRGAEIDIYPDIA
jgi:hypothetical protein